MKVGAMFHVPAALPAGKRPGFQSTGGWMAPWPEWTGWGKSRPHGHSIARPSSP